MNIVFLGTPEFSTIVLEKILKSNHKVLAVVCQPDRPSGRGHKVEMCPLKVMALEKNIPVLQFEKISRDGYDAIKALNPDLLITASFGQILRQNIIDLAPNGVLNVHGSILPKYRGSSPVQWQIINGEKIAGVTIMKTDIGLDTGDIITCEKLEVLPDETSGELMLRIANLGGELLVRVLDEMQIGHVIYHKQNNDEATYYPMLTKEMGRIDFNKSASEIQNLCNGLNPWPVCYVEYNDLKIKVFKAKPYICSENYNFSKLGEVVVSNDKIGLVVKCKDGFVEFTQIQAPNSKKMSAKDYLRGKSISVGTIFNLAGEEK